MIHRGWIFSARLWLSCSPGPGYRSLQHDVLHPPLQDQGVWLHTETCTGVPREVTWRSQGAEAHAVVYSHLLSRATAHAEHLRYFHPDWAGRVSVNWERSAFSTSDPAEAPGPLQWPPPSPQEFCTSFPGCSHHSRSPQHRWRSHWPPPKPNTPRSDYGGISSFVKKYVLRHVSFETFLTQIVTET